MAANNAAMVPSDPLLRPSPNSGLRRGLVTATNTATSTAPRADAWGKSPAATTTTATKARQKAVLQTQRQPGTAVGVQPDGCSARAGHAIADLSCRLNMTFHDASTNDLAARIIGAS